MTQSVLGYREFKFLKMKILENVDVVLEQIFKKKDTSFFDLHREKTLTKFKKTSTQEYMGQF